jgi:hypothetical protein
MLLGKIRRFESGGSESLPLRHSFLRSTVPDYQVNSDHLPARRLFTGGNMAVALYRQVGKGKAGRYQKVNLGRGRRPADLTSPYFLRYSLANGTRPWEHCTGEALAPFPSQRQEQEEICQGPIHSDSRKARLENQKTE